MSASSVSCPLGSPGVDSIILDFFFHASKIRDTNLLFSGKVLFIFGHIMGTLMIKLFLFNMVELLASFYYFFFCI